MRAVRLVQVGLGGWGLNWAEEVLPKIERLGEVAFVEVDEAARSRAIEAGLPARRVFADLDTAIAETKPQAMLATVPLAVHAPVARAGLERGLHVLVEKPFTETLAEARELVALAESRDLLLAVNQNYRYFPAVQGARAAVAWARRLRHDRGFDPAVEQAVAVAEVIDRAYGRA